MKNAIGLVAKTATECMDYFTDRLEDVALNRNSAYRCMVDKAVSKGEYVPVEDISLVSFPITSTNCSDSF